MTLTHAQRIQRCTNAALATVALAALLFAAPARAAWETPSLPTTQVAAAAAAPAPGITATIREPFYKVNAADVTASVAEQMHAQGVEAKAEVTLNPGTPNLLYSADHPVQVAIHTLQIDPKSKRWQAQAYFISNGKTESVKPVAGTYGALIDVPVVTRQFSRTDVIEEKDITILSVPERLLRKDTITNAKELVGLSPRAGISPNRPIHSNEITPPTVIKRGDLVEMAYETPYIHIKTTGIALEDGAKGATIRIKNQKSQHAVSAQVVSAGRVQVSAL